MQQETHFVYEVPGSPPASSQPSENGKRRDILDAALALFVDRGFHGTSVPALAQRANVGAGTIYRYFENKEAVVNAVYQECKESIGEHALDGLDPSLGAEEIFATFWRRTVEFARKNPRAFAFLELHHHASYLDAESRAVTERCDAQARSLLKQMADSGAVKDLPAELLISLVCGALTGFVRGAWEDRYPLDDDHSNTALRCTWLAIAS